MAIYDINGNSIGTAYDSYGVELETAYDISENVVYTGYTPTTGLDYSSLTRTQLFVYKTNRNNGFDVHNGIIAQLQADDKLYLFELDGTAISTSLTIDCDHGDSATFSREYYAIGDEFPLLYCTNNGSPALLYVNRISRSSVDLIKTYKFSVEDAGYAAGLSYDLDNNIMYMIGYTRNDAFTDTDNPMIVSIWNPESYTQNEDGTITPALIRSYTIPFIYVAQGQTFFDGLMWVASGYPNTEQYIYGLMPDTGRIIYSLHLDNKVETEGLAFYYDPQIQNYCMIIGQQNGSSGIIYSRLDFDTL